MSPLAKHNLFDLIKFLFWYINYCWLFNAKSSLYLYIKYIGFVLVGLGFMTYQPL